MMTDPRASVLIVDDEPVAREGLRRMLGGVSWLRVVGEAADGRTAAAQIDALTPDMVLLDVEMPGLTGLDVLRRVAHQPLVIFTTAHAQHAVTAFELGAVDYLLKPFGQERLDGALEKVRAALGEPAGTPALERLAEIMAVGPISRLFVRTGNAIVPVSVSDIAWFEARGDYVAAHAGAARHLLHLSLNRLEERLEPRRFARLHRGHIVNLDRVKAFRSDGRGRMVAQLDDGTVLPVSRSKSQELRALSR